LQTEVNWSEHKGRMGPWQQLSESEWQANTEEKAEIEAETEVEAKTETETKKGKGKGAVGQT